MSTLQPEGSATDPPIGSSSGAAHESVLTRSVRAVKWGVIGSIGRIAGSLIVQITLARMLDPHAFGQFAAVLVMISFGAMFADFGFGAALIQRKSLSPNDIRVALGWSLSLASLVALAILVGAPAIAAYYRDPSLTPMYQVCALVILLHAFSNISQNLLRRELNHKSLQLINIVGYGFVYGGVGISLAYLGFGGWSLVLAFLCQSIFTLVSSYALTRHPLMPRLKGERSIFGFGVKAFANDLSIWSIEHLDQTLIGRFWGLGSLGLYSVTISLAKAPTALLTYVMQTVAFASSARLQDNVLAVQRGYLAVLSALALLMLPLFSLVSIESETILRVVYGSKWIAAAPIMSIIALAMPLVAMCAITASILRGIGAVGLELKANLFGALLLLVGLIALSGTALTIAIWIVPIAYLGRLAALAYFAYQKLEFSGRSLASAFKGGTVLACVGMAATALVTQVGEIRSHAWGLLPLMTGLITILMALLLWLRWFAGEPLSQLLGNHLLVGRWAWLGRRFGGQNI